MTISSQPLPPLTPDVAASIARSDPVMSKNTEQGFANTYGPRSNIPDGLPYFAVPAAGAGALGLYWLYKKYREDREAARAAEPKVKIAAIDWHAVRSQLPGAHTPDLLLGGAAGAGAGLLYDYVRGGEKGKRLPTALKRILGGAAIGAGATNLAGDRLRRYITNSSVLTGYDSDKQLKQLYPRNWQHVWDAAIADKPSYHPDSLKELAERYAVSSADIGKRLVAARREIERIGMNVDTHNPRNSIWQRNAGGRGPQHYSLNEKNPEYKSNLAALYLPKFLDSASMYAPGSDNTVDTSYINALGEKELIARDPLHVPIPPRARVMDGFGKLVTDAGNDQWDMLATPKPGGVAANAPFSLQPLFTEPATEIAKINSPDGKYILDASELFGGDSLVGAQQIPTRQNGANLEGMTLDRFDITPSQADTDELYKSVVSGGLFDKTWRGSGGDTASGYNRGQTNWQTFKSTLGRMVWDRVLRQEHPWISQKFRFAPPTAADKDIGHSLQFMKNDGTPAAEPINRVQLGGHLDDVHAHKLNPLK